MPNLSTMAILWSQRKKSKEFHDAVVSEVTDLNKETDVSKQEPTPKQAMSDAAQATKTMLDVLLTHLEDRVSPIEEEQREEVSRVIKNIWKKNKVRKFIEDTQQELSEKKKARLAKSIADKCDKATQQD